MAGTWFTNNEKSKPQKLTQHPPRTSPHAPKDVHKIVGDQGGPQGPGVHHSLKKPGLMK